MRLSLNKLLGLPPTARKWTFALGELVTEPPLSSVLGGGRNQPWGGASLAQGHPPRRDRHHLGRSCCSVIPVLSESLCGGTLV